MSHAISDQPRVELSSSARWSPSERCRRWLLIGTVALLVDLALGVAVVVLEFRHWGEGGFTPDVVVAYTALPAQLLLVVAYLVLARDAGIRGLWKSAAGMFGSYLLLCLLEPAMLEVLSATANTTILIATALGIVGLLMFSISEFPHFGGSEHPSRQSPPDSSGPSWATLGWALAAYVIAVSCDAFPVWDLAQTTGRSSNSSC